MRGVRLHVWVLATVALLLTLAFDARSARAEDFTIASPACEASELITRVAASNGNNQNDSIDLNGCVITLTEFSADSIFGATGLPLLLEDNSHTLTIRNGTIRRSSAGGTPNFRIINMAVDASLTLEDVTISGGNLSGGFAAGGGINNEGGGSLTLINSTVSGNTLTATTEGGGAGFAFGAGILSGGTLTLTNSTVSGNSANSSGPSVGDAIAHGGGIYVLSGTATLINSTISGNSASAADANSSGQGGGIYVEAGALTLIHSTVTNNSVAAVTTARGAGVANAGGSPVTVRGSIVALQQNNSDCFGTFATIGSNIESGTSCNFVGNTSQRNVTSAQLKLGTLANNGGPTQTHALLEDSVAIDAVLVACTQTGLFGGAPISTDQRGVVRAQDGNGAAPSICDIGAFERAPGTIQFNPASYSVGEGGGTVTITVTRVGGTDEAVGATVTLGGGTSTATPGADYTNATFPINFAAGDAVAKTFTITILQDTFSEAGETVLLTLGSPTGDPVLGGTATLTITDDDAAPTLSIGNATVPEGNTGSTTAQFTVTLSTASGQTVTVQAQTANVAGPSGATAPGDYTAVTQPVTFNPGETTKTVDVPVQGDTTDEVDETFTVTLSGASNATIVTATGTGTITDDDTSQVSIDDVAVVEGNGGSTPATFTVSLSVPNSRPVTVQATTASQNASAGSDYTTVTQPITFNPGETSKTLVVAVLGDTADEPNETFVMNLSDAVNATIVDTQGVGTILDDDGPPALSIVDRSVVEGDGGTTNAVFTVFLLPASGLPVTVQAQTVNGTAVAGQDYTAVGPVPLVFNPGVTTQTVNVPIVGDTIVEPAETFTVRLSGAVNATFADEQAVGTIVDDDVAGGLSFAATSVSVPELAGSVTLTVQRGGGGTDSSGIRPSAAGGSVVAPSALGATTVTYATANGTAQAGEDFTASSGTLSFGVNETTKTIVIPIINDSLQEGPEQFTVVLANPTGGVSLGQATATVTIVDTTHGAPTPPGDDSADDEREERERETEEERRQRARTNQGNRDDDAVEGDVIEVRCDQPWPAVVIANRDGLVEVKLVKEAQKACSSISVGDYLEADGEKQHEQLFHADSVDIK